MRIFTAASLLIVSCGIVNARIITYFSVPNEPSASKPQTNLIFAPSHDNVPLPTFTDYVLNEYNSRNKLDDPSYEINIFGEDNTFNRVAARQSIQYQQPYVPELKLSIQLSTNFLPNFLGSPNFQLLNAAQPTFSKSTLIDDEPQTTAATTEEESNFIPTETPINSEDRPDTLYESDRESARTKELINILKYFKMQSTDNNKDWSYILENKTTDNLPTTTDDQLDSNLSLTYKYEPTTTEETPFQIEVETSEDNSSKDESETAYTTPDYLSDNSNETSTEEESDSITIAPIISSDDSYSIPIDPIISSAESYSSPIDPIKTDNEIRWIVDEKWIDSYNYE